MTDLEKYNSVFCECLDVCEGQLQSLKFQEVPNWDSLGHMTLVSGLEDTFDIQFDTDDIIDFNSYKKGKEILMKLGVDLTV